ncbi:TetR/AcrR family transcriptional regulator [Actinomadura sp. WMMB 499]|uniref:TetR/AcrR family transcriptional regulator n=1 Tax=Actinomadura sp. WMMB 499 TaxID=1219491 RepID=UPI0012446517|nr:TetR/AcrR family transcriptional regulator [Actinomadura sp. WMMB 499]QFG21935.1 TetR/AcrR family transcriptional regulator [Actinomadura sp. WMMB 499]
MTDTAAPQPRRRDRGATRAALLDAARLRFSRQGYDGTGIREIAGDVGVDPALISRYFGSKEKLYAEAVRVDVPSGLTSNPDRPLVHITDELLREVVFGDWEQFDGEHPLLVMLRSSGQPAVREQLRDQICGDYLSDFADRLQGDDAALRAELIGALLLGMGVMRSVVDSPALGKASYEETRMLVARLVHTLTHK